MNKDINKCPYCGSMEKFFQYSTTTLLAFVQRYDKDGNALPLPNPNTTRNYYNCISCGQDYSHDE